MQSPKWMCSYLILLKRSYSARNVCGEAVSRRLSILSAHLSGGSGLSFLDEVGRIELN